MAKKLCDFLSGFILVMGTLGAIALAYFAGNTVTISKTGELAYERSWVATASLFIGGMISVLILFAMLKALSEILDKQERQDEKLNSLLEAINRTERNASGYAESKPASKSDKQYFSPDEKKVIEDGGWKCAQCGRINYSMMSVCQRCGKARQ